MATGAQKLGIQDTFYVSHGSPTFAIDDSFAAHHFLKSFTQDVVPEKPKAILIISAHWLTSDPTVNAVSGINDTIYDFYGFPDELYRLKYPAPGSPELAGRVKQLLEKSGFERVRNDRKRGLDHGAWVPLMLMYPEADIPVVQLSIQIDRDAAHHFRLGKALRPLKDDGVLIVGSGAFTHNVRVINPKAGESPDPWAREFVSFIWDAVAEGRYDDVNDYERKAPHAKVAHPWPDHIYPLHVAMGAAGEGTHGEVIHNSWNYGAMSHASFKFTQNPN